MTTTSQSFVRRAYDVGNTIACALAVLGGIAVIYVIPSAILNGPRLRAAAEQARASEIAAEDRQLCDGVGLTSNTAAFSDCIRGLRQIRQKQDERWRRDTEGFL
jgi:hypothetical protein